MIALQLGEDYDLAVRIVRDKEGRILGGLSLAETTPQNQALLLLMHQGELKEAPAFGVGITDMPLDHRPLYWRARIREQLELDGQRVDRVSITAQGITIDAHD